MFDTPIRTRLSVSSEQAPPSLKQLQAIDSDQHSLHDKLTLLVRVLDDTPAREPERPAPGHSRIQWAVKWLLQRLSSQSPDGEEARLEVDCWDLLREFMTVLPKNIAAQALTTHSYLSIVDMGLQDAGKGQQTKSDPISSSASSSVSSPAPAPTPSPGKRKREPQAPLTGTSKRSKATGDNDSVLSDWSERHFETLEDLDEASSSDNSDLEHAIWIAPEPDPSRLRSIQAGDAFVAICQCLATVVQLDSTPSADLSQTASGGRMHNPSILRTDFKSATRMLGTGLRLARASSWGRRKRSTAGPLVDPFISVWTNAGPLDEDDKAVTFSEDAIMPALDLLHAKCAVPAQRWKRNGVTDRFPDRLEQVIRKGFILPAREIYRHAHGSAANKSGSKDANAVTLGTLMEPLKRTISALDASRADSLIRSLYNLFRLGSDSFSSRTPKQRLTELPWVSHLLESVAELVQLPQNLSPYDQRLMPATRETLKQLLETCLLFKITVKREFLQRLVITYSSRLDLEPQPPNGALVVIGAALKLDPEAVLVDNATDAEAQLAMQQALDYLLKFTREKRWTNKRLDVNDEDFWDPFLDSSRSLTYDVKHNFTFPLLHAHVNSRIFPKFLQLWYEQLSAAFELSVVDLAPIIRTNFRRRQVDSVWAEVDFYVEVASKVRHALSPKAFCDLVNVFQARLKSSYKVNRAQRDACLVVLLGLLSNISDPDYIRPIENSLIAIINVCRRLVLKATWEDESRWPIWRVLKVSFLHWISVVKDPMLGADGPLEALGLTAIQDHMGLLFGHLRNLPKFETEEDALEAFCCWGAIAETMDLRSVPMPGSGKDWPVHLAQLGSMIQPKNPKLLPSLLGICVSRYPHCLAEVLPGSGGEYVLRNLLASMLTAVGLRETVLEESQEGWRSMGADVVKVFNECRSQGRQVFTQVAENALEGYTNLDMDLPLLLTQINRMCIYTHLDAFPKHLSLSLPSTILEAVQEQEVEDLDITEMMMLLARLHPTIAPTPLMPQVIWVFAQAVEYKYASIIPDEDDVSVPFKDALRVFEMLVRQLLRETKQQKLDTSNLWQHSTVSLRQISIGEAIFATGDPATLQRGALLATRLLLQYANQHPEEHQGAKGFRGCVAEILSKELAEPEIPKIIWQGEVEAEVFQIISLFDGDDEPGKQTWLNHLESQKPRDAYPRIPFSRAWSSEFDIMVAASQIRSCSGDSNALYRTLHDMGVKFCDTYPPVSEYEVFSLFINEHIATLSDDDKKSTLPGTVDLLGVEIRNRVKANADGALCILHALVTASDGWASMLNGSTLIVKLSTLLLDEQSYENCRMAIACIVTLLRVKNAKPSQHAIETLLHALTTMLSPQSQLNEPAAPRHYYALITTATQTILTHPVTRKHLRGRMHILLPLLQNALHPLFAPHPAVSPPWHNTTTPLAPREAHRLARLLSTVADPSAGAVAARARAKAALTDETARAREYAARFAGPLLAELAACMLRGRWCADGVREALLPGVWAVFGGVARVEGGLEVLSAGLPGGAREVVRGLIGEWRRSGGG